MAVQPERKVAATVIDAVLGKDASISAACCRSSSQKSMLHILNLVQSSLYIDVIVSNCVKAKDVQGRAFILVIALDEIEFIVLLQDWTWEGRLRGF